MPLDLARPHEPEPDLVAIKGSLREQRRHPKRADLIIEVADSTLRYDRIRKGSLYASAGIRDYWIVNLLDRQLEIRREATPDLEAEFGHSYADVRVHQPREMVSALTAPGGKMKVADLLP
jgi:Uma2 family endonuclease